MLTFYLLHPMSLHCIFSEYFRRLELLQKCICICNLSLVLDKEDYNGDKDDNSNNDTNITATSKK